jgi:ribA/ribD-fused uncharacterized protein
MISRIQTKHRQDEAMSALFSTTVPKIDHFAGAYRFLSNFYPVSVPWGYFFYSSVEHAYQAAKCVRDDQKEAIRLLKKPGEAKRRGRTVELRKDWDQVKLHVMHVLLSRKFADVALADKLVSTYPRELIEGNDWDDTYWGVDVNKGGENHLGNLLMQVRVALLSMERP